MKKLDSAIKQTDLGVNCTEYYLIKVEYAEVKIDVMVGGQSRDLINNGLNKPHDNIFAQ